MHDGNIWNKLPLDIRTCASLQGFGKILKTVVVFLFLFFSESPMGLREDGSVWCVPNLTYSERQL